MSLTARLWRLMNLIYYAVVQNALTINWLIDWCFTARQHKIGQFVPIYQGGLLAQAFETYSYMRYNEHTHATTNNRYALYLLKDKQCLQQITRPRMGKKTQAGVEHLLYQLFIITLAPLPPTISQIPHHVLGVVAIFRHAQDIVWQFRVLHVANCHDKIWWTMSDYFPVYWFWATVCASTRYNRYNCALPRETVDAFNTLRDCSKRTHN